MFVDSHSHIHFKKEFPDTPGVIKRAKGNKVLGQILVGCTFNDSLAALDFANKYADDNFWCALGVHPHDASDLDEEVINEFYQTAESEEKVVAIGEIGLDFFRNLSPKELQYEAFEKQINLAKELDLPVIAHVRDAWTEAMNMLSKSGHKKVVLHSFTGDIETACNAWDLGFITSFSGMITYPKNEDMRDIVRVAPMEQIFIETDCPYLPPQKYRGQKNEPAFVVEVAKQIGELRNLSKEEVGRITTENAERVFGIKIIPLSG
ncbi:YchF/TatD family DNA exonuclease [Candidatus Peregrinibacteria bacterium]|nr:YchF/TatD family DNA exonuclease [Candidatus Peregrinibacteria bacterium]